MQAGSEERGVGVFRNPFYSTQTGGSAQDYEHYCSSNDGSYSAGLRSISPNQYCTLESSSTNYSSFQGHDSPSTAIFPSGESPSSQQHSQAYPLDDFYQSPETYFSSPVSSSSITDDACIKYKLEELKSAMLGPDADFMENFERSFINEGPLLQSRWKELLEHPNGDITQSLISCAKAVAENNGPLMERYLTEVRAMVSVSGEPLQRVGAYMLEGLVARLSCSGSLIYKTLKCKEPTSSELLSYMHLLYEVCPYFKFGYMSANGAIAEAVKDEPRVHIIDFQIAQGSQWVTLIQAFAARPGGPPHLRITGIDDPQSSYARGGGLHLVGNRLIKLANSCNVPFEFHAAAIDGIQVTEEHFQIYPDEALAVNFPFQLHHMPDESVSTDNHRDRLLRMIKKFSPRVVTLIEQESNTNTAPFLHRFVETLTYYTAIFESIDARLPRDDEKRISVEQHCLARDIVNIIACEGAERVERHELLGKWSARFKMAGFHPYPLSSLVNNTIKELLKCYSEKYRLEEKDGVLYLGWLNKALVVSCAWQ